MRLSNTYLRLTNITIMILLLILLDSWISIPQAKAYSCVSSHCYGEVMWSVGTIGSYTQISVSNLTSGNAFTTTETWVVDASYHWVEGGQHSQLGYFTAETSPSTGYHENAFGHVPSGDYGRTFQVEILKTQTANQWQVHLTSPNTNYGYAYWSDNSMTASRIDTGQELSGTAGAASSNTQYTLNKWVDSNYYSHYQNTDGSLFNPVSPPYVSWSVKPSLSSTGGTLQTSCC